VGPASVRPTIAEACWSPRPTIIESGCNVGPHKLGSWQKDPTTRYPSGPNATRQQGLTPLSYAWQKNPTTKYPSRHNIVGQQGPTSLVMLDRRTQHHWVMLGRMTQQLDTHLNPASLGHV